MIAISYRREDSLPITGRLYDRLQSEFGRDSVFMDFDSIPYGVDFRDHIKQMIDRSKVLVAIIGQDWVGRRRHRGRRIDEPTDFVRLEIAYALERNLPIIPILVGNTEMPQSEELPQDIQALAFRNGLRLDAGIDFHHHAERLSAAINRILTASAPPKPAEPEKPKIAAPPETPTAPAEPQPEIVTTEPVSITEMPAVTEAKTISVERKKGERPLEKNAVTPAIGGFPSTKDRERRRVIDLQAQINAIRTTFGKLGQGASNTASAITSGIGRLFKSIGNNTRNFFQGFSEQLRRQRKTIAIAAMLIVGLASAGGAIYWGIRSGTFRHLVVQTTDWFKSKNTRNIQPTPLPPAVPATGPPAAGILKIDSTPQGEAYEVIDSKNQHHIGRTPETLENLPKGYVQVFFRREGFLDRNETVWFSPDMGASVSWNFPETDRIKTSPQLSQSAMPSPVVASASIPPSAQPSVGIGQYQRTNDGHAYVWNNYPRTGDSADWSGDTDSQGHATGYGTLTWYKNRKLVSRYIGTMVSGKFSGFVTNEDADGKRFHGTYVDGHQSSDWSEITATPETAGSPTSSLANAPTPPGSPTPAVAASPPAQNGRVWQDQISDFVRQFLAVNQSQDANATVAFYAPSVDYFGNRGRDHAFILRDVQKYNVDWPARRDSIDGEISVEEKVPNQQYRASFKLNLYTENPKSGDWSKGQVATTLDINIIDGAPKIVAFNQRKLQRPQHGKGRGPRPADMPPPEPPGPISATKLTKVLVKKYGFSALVPTEMFPDAEAKLADGTTDHLNSVKGCATMAFSAPHDDVRKVFDDFVNQFNSAPERRTIDYKAIKDTWFAVSGSTRTTGYYVKGVKHGDDVFVMELDYVGAVCRIPASMVARISHAFNGEIDAPPTSANPSSSPGSTTASASNLTKTYIKRYGMSVLLPTDVFPNATKLTTGEETEVTAADNLTRLEFYDSNDSLAKSYRSRIADSHDTQGRTIEYKTLKENWFVISGKFAPDVSHATSMGFYTKAVKKGSKVIFMHIRYNEEDPLIGDQVLTAMSRSFDGK